MMNEIKDLNLDELINANGGSKDDAIDLIKKQLKEKGIPSYNEKTIEQIMDEKRKKYNPTKRPYDPTRSGELVRR